MAIKYNTKTGPSWITAKGMEKKEFVLKPKLGRMHCSKCAIDSTISFKQHDAYPNSNAVDWVLDACCYEFEQRIYAKLEVERPTKF